MKPWKCSVILLSVCLLMLSSGLVSAQTLTDGQNDVIRSSQGHYTGGQIQPEIDIKQITYSFEDGFLLLELEVYGIIQETTPYAYYATLKTTGAQYSIGLRYGTTQNFFQRSDGTLLSPPILTVNGSVMSAFFTEYGNSTVVDVSGHAEYVASEGYVDWLPDSKGPVVDTASGDDSDEGNSRDDDTTNGNQTGGDTDGNTSGGSNGTAGTGGNGGVNDTAGNNGNNQKKGTPGFETIAVLAAVGISYFLLNRRK